MALFRGIQEYIALDANNITLVFDLGNIVNISGNIFLYPPQGHPILYQNLQRYIISHLLMNMKSYLACLFLCSRKKLYNFATLKKKQAKLMYR